jgi:predicted dehydrogenase
MYKCVIIGLGQIGMGYDLYLDSEKAVYTHSKAFSLHPFFELVGAVDDVIERRELFSVFYKKPAFDNLATALNDLEPEIIVIATPTESHYAIIQQVVKHKGIVSILCEKPLAYNINEARSIVQSCEYHKIRLFVNYMRCSDPGVLEVKRRIQIGQIKSPVKGVVWYSKGLLNNGSHFFNLLEFWLGPYVKSSKISSGRPVGKHDSEPDFVVNFEKGQIVFMSVWEEAFSHYTVELLSTSGRLRYDKGGELITFEGTHADEFFSGYTILANEEIIHNEMYHSQWNVVDQLSNALQNRPYSICSGVDALNTLEAIEKIINE